MASQIYQIPYATFIKLLEAPETAEEYSLLRSGVKACSFGIPYGAGPNRIAAQIRFKNDFKRFPNTGGKEPWEDALKRAKKLIGDYLGKCVQLAAFLEQQKEFAAQHGFTRSPKFRIRWYQLPEKGDPEYHERIARIKRCATNHPIQGGNADVLKTALPYIYRSFREGGKMNGRNLYGGARIIMVVHDEIVVTAPAAHIEAVRMLLKEGMEWAYAQIAMNFGGDEGMHYLKEIANKVDVTPACDHWIKG
jgi:DNA polymerase I-like protein with 3'-5' exonuclease and polymerase domains